MTESILMRKLTFEEIQSNHLSINELKALKRSPIIALADDIRSLHNVGALFRTADGINLEKLYLCGITATPPRTEIRKTSLGAERAVPWKYEKNALQTITSLKKEGVQIVALEHTDQSVDYREADYRFPCCLLIGNEYEGLQTPLVEQADIAIEIPMMGIKQSLNVSVAFGIALYEMFRHMQLRENE
jgi:tRNA G18 (ribose-2'-O)-methylase SpoU